MALQSSQRLPELLFYTKKSYRILQAPIPAPILQGYPYTIHIYTCTLQRILHPEIQFYMQKTKSSSSTTTTYRGQRDLHSRFQKRNSTHRRQGDLLESIRVSYKTFQALQPQSPYKGNSSYSSYSRDIPVFPDIPDIPVFPIFPDIPVVPDTPETFRTFQSFMTFQPFQAILQILHCSSISRDSTPVQHSPIRMHILQFDWFPENSTEYQLNNTNYKHSTDITFFKEREML